MKRRQQTKTRRLAAGAAIVLLALLVLLGMATAQPSEANQPQAQITGLFNPNFNDFILVLPTATPRPFDLTGVLIDPNLTIQSFVTVPPILSIPTAIPTPEPCGHAITVGKAVNDTLKGGGQYCEYTFAARAGQTVTVTMRRTTGSIDPLIELRDPSGIRMGLDDDSDGRSNSALRGITLPEAGTYTVLARSFDPAAGGTFQLNVSAGRPSQPAGANLPGADEVVCNDALRYGQAIEGQVPFPGAQCWYTFDGMRGDTVALYLKSLDGSPLPDLQLLDARDRPVTGDAAQLDDGTTVASSLVLPANGVYTIVLTDATDDGAGPFELSLIRQDPCKDVLQNDPLRVELSSDSPVCTLALRDRPSFLSSIQLETISGDVQPLVQFYGPNGEFLDEYLADGTSQDVPPNAWTVVVEGYDGTSGVVEIEVSGGLHLLSQEFCGRNIQNGQFISDDMSPFSPYCSYYFEGQAGDIVTIRMTRMVDLSPTATPAELDPLLTLLDPNDDPEISDDDSGGLPNSLIQQHELQASGTYTIVAGSYNDATTGPFYLTFWQRSP